MNRRRFLRTVTVSLLAAPLAGEAQQAGKVYRIGFLTGFTPPHLFEAFRQGLRDLGWTEGQNVVLEYLSAEGRLERIADLAAELVRRKVDLLVLTATAVHGARQATAGVPAVFITTDDPVTSGFVANLAHPGGRMTGVTSLNVELDAKRLEILKAALPGVVRVGVLSTPHDVTNRQRVAVIERAAGALGLQLHLLQVSGADLLPGVFDAARRARVTALMILGSPLLLAHQARIVELASKARLPVISAWREFPAAGGLMSYGTDVSAMFYRAASYVDRIFKGANPAGLPVEQAATFELVINLKVAKTLGLTIPQSLRARADHVIE